MLPILYIIIPCYNEEEVLPITSKLFLEKLLSLINENKIDSMSKIMFVNDGSKDNTWKIICELSESDEHYVGISQTKNRGHQNALLAGLMEAKEYCDITITMDCDGQDDFNAIDEMLSCYTVNNCEIVYGVRKDRDSDTLFKRTTAVWYYRIMKLMGIEIIFNHADFRLLSKNVLEELSEFKEVNIFLRGIIPLIGFKSTSIYYTRKPRVSGKSKYPFSKMLSFAFEGITGFSVKPIKLITGLGFIIALISFIGVIWSIVRVMSGNTVVGWASTTSIICFVSGIQLLSIGIIGQYVGKIYMEVKKRPRYIIDDRAGDIGDKK